MIYAKTIETDAGPLLQTMRREDGALSTSERGFGVDQNIPEQQVLQSGLHGECDGGRDKSPKREEQSASVGENSNRILSGVWKIENQTLRPPQRRESAQQRSVKLDDIVRLMPSAYALAVGASDTATIEALQSLFPSGSPQRILQYPLVAFQEAWECPSREAIQRAWNACLLGNFVISISSPLAIRVKGDIELLRGFGNSIVPETAAQFIQAFVEAKAAMRSGETILK